MNVLIFALFLGWSRCIDDEPFVRSTKSILHYLQNISHFYIIIECKMYYASFKKKKKKLTKFKAPSNKKYR